MHYVMKNQKNNSKFKICTVKKFLQDIYGNHQSHMFVLRHACTKVVLFLVNNVSGSQIKCTENAKKGYTYLEVYLDL